MRREEKERSLFDEEWEEVEASSTEVELHHPTQNDAEGEGEIIQQVKELRRRLTQYEYEYYVLHQPTISDGEFDALLRELEDLEQAHPQFITPDSPTQRVGSEFIGHQSGETYQHRYPMLSLANSYSWEEVLQFHRRVAMQLGEEAPWVAELKFDGVSISLIYRYGLLVRALTRGDGIRGEDVTEAVRAIPSVPHQLIGEDLPEYLEVRGEVLLPWAQFEAINLRREEQELPPFANPRNAVAGTIKTKERVDQVVREREPVIYFYYLLSDDEAWLPRRHSERLERMRELGLFVDSHSKLCRTPGELKEYLDYWDLNRHELPIPTDGVVLKVDDYETHKVLGATAKSPRWAFAYKFNAESGITMVREVRFQVARTGAVTPVAELDPIELSGTMVSRATLHNADIIEALDLHIGDLVDVEKGGEIIPKITRVHQEQRSEATGPKVVMPEECPICHTPLVRQADQAATFCPNSYHCPAQIEARIEHFCSRKAMDINVGPKTIELLHRLLQVKDPADLYALTEEDLLRLPSFKEQKASNLLQSIAASRAVPFDRVLYALGIKLIGVQVAQQLASVFRSIDQLASASSEELQEVEEIGPMIAESLQEYFDNESNRALVERLREAGVQLALPEQSMTDEARGEALKGLSIVVSGIFHTMSRDELKTLIAQEGGKVVGSISGKTSMVVAGDKMGPSKLQKAEELGIRIIGEEELLELIKKGRE